MTVSQIQHTAAQNSGLLATLAAFNKAAGDELRLQILHLMHRDSYSVTELATIFATKQSGMSHHLKVLAEAGLVKRRREGNSIFYSRSQHPATERLLGLQQALLDLTAEVCVPAAVDKRITESQVLRASHSRSFFEQHSGEFTLQQEQISEFDVYAQPVIELLDELTQEQRTTVLEIGPGSGHFLTQLAQRFDHVIALDNSKEMLDSARQHCQSAGIYNSDDEPANKISFVLGDTKAALQRDIVAPHVVLNMVLHHIASPADMIRDISALLENNGRLYVAELCDHNQDWVRESCGDLWLGIDPEALSGWAEQNSLSEIGNGQYLSLRNGFRLQIRQFLKSSSKT